MDIRISEGILDHEWYRFPADMHSALRYIRNIRTVFFTSFLLFFLIFFALFFRVFSQLGKSKISEN